MSAERNPALGRVAVSGASGLVGSALTRALAAKGHEVLRLVRKKAAGPGEIAWDPDAGTIEEGKLEGLEAVVHLAGESIASGRWTAERKKRILESREKGTRVLCQAIGRLQKPPRVLVSASAVGYYDDGDGETRDETSKPGRNFLAQVCEAWEAATAPARAAGVRVVNLRIGVVLSKDGGALAKMLPPFKLGVGGPVGRGTQPMSWIAIDDLVAAIQFAIRNPALFGPVNATAPGAVTNAEFARALGRVLGRPAALPLPAFAVKLMFGEMGETVLLRGARVRPKRLQEADFHFQYPELEGALRRVLGK